MSLFFFLCCCRGRTHCTAVLFNDLKTLKQNNVITCWRAPLIINLNPIKPHPVNFSDKSGSLKLCIHLMNKKTVRRWTGHDISMYLPIHEFGEGGVLASHALEPLKCQFGKDFSETGFWKGNKTCRCSFHFNTTQQMAQF